jgi:hypothetical protein
MYQICHDIKPLITRISIIYFPFKNNEAYTIPLRACVRACVCVLFTMPSNFMRAMRSWRYRII